ENMRIRLLDRCSPFESVLFATGGGPLGYSTAAGVWAVVLLERDGVLNELDGALAEVAGGKGYLVLIGGEAGMGQPALVGEFARRYQSSVPAYWGACDALFTPRPFGPLREIAAQMGGVLHELLRDTDTDRSALLTAAHAELARRRCLVVFE